MRTISAWKFGARKPEEVVATNYPGPVTDEGSLDCVSVCRYICFIPSLSLFFLQSSLYTKEAGGWLQKLLDYTSRAAMPGDPEGALEELPKWRKSRRGGGFWDEKKKSASNSIRMKIFPDMEADGTYKQNYRIVV